MRHDTNFCLNFDVLKVEVNSLSLSVLHTEGHTINRMTLGIERLLKLLIKESRSTIYLIRHSRLTWPC